MNIDQAFEAELLKLGNARTLEWSMADELRKLGWDIYDDSTPSPAPVPKELPPCDDPKKPLASRIEKKALSGQKIHKAVTSRLDAAHEAAKHVDSAKRMGILSEDGKGRVSAKGMMDYLDRRDEAKQKLWSLNNELFLKNYANVKTSPRLRMIIGAISALIPKVKTASEKTAVSWDRMLEALKARVGPGIMGKIDKVLEGMKGELRPNTVAHDLALKKLRLMGKHFPKKAHADQAVVAAKGLLREWHGASAN